MSGPIDSSRLADEKKKLQQALENSRAPLTDDVVDVLPSVRRSVIYSVLGIGMQPGERGRGPRASIAPDLVMPGPETAATNQTCVDLNIESTVRNEDRSHDDGQIKIDETSYHDGREVL